MDNTLSTQQMKMVRAAEQRPVPQQLAARTGHPADRAEPPDSAERIEPITESQQAMMEKLAAQFDDFVRQTGRQLEFYVNGEQTGRVVILVKNSDSGEVVRTIPPEEARRLAESAGFEGLLIDRRA